MKSLWIVAATALALTTALPAMASTFTYSGGLSPTPTFDSPDLGTPPTQPVGIGSIFPYSSQAFSVDAGGIYSFTSTPISFTTNPINPGPTNWNPVAVLYQTAFNPANPLTNALIAQAPATLGNGTPVSFNFNLLANTPYFWVTTVFNPDDGYGTFTNIVTGSGNITTTLLDDTVIPTPALLPAMLGFGMKFATDRRKQKRHQRQPQAV
jgi:hypothetical protein